MTEEQVREEWSKSDIPRAITQSEVDNWVRHGSEGQLQGELGRNGSTSAAREHSNVYHQERGQWDKVVNADTGEFISGWKDPNSGSISMNPKSSYGEGSIPLWGRVTAQNAKMARARDLYDQSVEGGYDSETQSWNTGLSNSVEGDWIAIPTGTDIDDGRLTVIKHEGKNLTTTVNGEERILYSKVSKKKKFGIMGEGLSKKWDKNTPGDVKNMAAAIIDVSTAGFGDNLAGGDNLARRSTKTQSGIFGGRDKDWAKVNNAAPVAISSVVGAVLSPFTAGQSLWIPVAVGAAQQVGGGITVEAQGGDADWGKIAENVAISAATTYATIGISNAAKVGTIGTKTALAANVATNAGASAVRGADWTDIAISAFADTVAPTVAKKAGAGGTAALRIGEGYAKDEDPTTTLANTAFNMSINEAAKKVSGEDSTIDTNNMIDTPIPIDISSQAELSADKVVS